VASYSELVIVGLTSRTGANNLNLGFSGAKGIDRGTIGERRIAVFC
jgi:hypothetical protein